MGVNFFDTFVVISNFYQQDVSTKIFDEFICNNISIITIYKELASREYIDTRGVMVIEVGNGHSDTSSNPGRG